MSTRPDAEPSATFFRTAALAWAAVIFMPAAAPAAPAPAGDEFASPDGQYLIWLDRAVAARVNFFRFANGGWLRTHPIPADQSYWGVDAALAQDNEEFIRGLVESLTKTPWPPGNAQRKIADFYLSGMDEGGIETAGLAPLRAELARIAAIGTAAELPQAMAHLQSIGISAPLQIGQMQYVRRYADPDPALELAGIVVESRPSGDPLAECGHAPVLPGRRPRAHAYAA